MIHIEDNFFKDPFSVRNIALKSTYEPKVEFNYPGYRTGVPDHLREYVLSNVKTISGNSNLKILPEDISFQYIPKIYGTGSFHSDDTIYTCVIYLSINSPDNTGTEVCDFDHETSVNRRLGKLKESFFADPTNLIKRQRYNLSLKVANSFYKPIVKVPSKFNRAVIFPGNNVHRAQNFFGTSAADSRLTLVSFFV